MSPEAGILSPYEAMIWAMLETAHGREPTEEEFGKACELPRGVTVPLKYTKGDDSV